VPIHSSGLTVFSFPHIEGITLSASEEVDEVAGEATGMGEDRIDVIGDRTSEGQVSGVCGAGFTVGPLGKKGAKGGQRRTRSVLTRI
jgi:hypothetical protein